jgi:hypothetical protein
MKFNGNGSIFFLLCLGFGFGWTSAAYGILLSPSGGTFISFTPTLFTSLSLILGFLVSGVCVMGAGILAVIVGIGGGCDNNGRAY